MFPLRDSSVTNQAVLVPRQKSRIFRDSREGMVKALQIFLKFSDLK